MVVSLVNELPDCILLRIFTYCNCKVDLWRARIVCMRWYILLADSHLWRVCDLSCFKFNDTRLLRNIVQYVPMDELKYIEISDNVVITESMHIILETSNHLRGLQLNDCELRPNVNEPFLAHLTMAPTSLEFLDMRRTKGDVRVLGDLLQHTGSHLKVLGISNTFSSILLIKARPFLCYVGNLTILECDDCTWVNDETIRDIADCCPSLQALNVPKCLNVQGTTMEKLIRKCTQLRNLVLRRTSVRNEEMLRAKWTNSKITGLDISHCYYLQDSACRYVVRTLAPQLTHLCCAFTDELIQDLTSFTNLPMKSLEIRRRYLLDMDAVTNFLSNCSLLESLDLTLSPVDFHAFQGILPNLPNLKWISIAGHEVLRTADSLGLLTKFCKNIKEVGINYYHAPCKPSLDKILFNFLVDNKNIKCLNLEGVYTHDVRERLQTMADDHFMSQQRCLNISKSREFNLPANELSVESVASKFRSLTSF